MKTSKTLLRKISLFAAVIAFTTVFSSCSDDDNIEEGMSLNLKVVNAAEGSGSQELYLEGTKITTVAEGESQGYVATANSGNNKNLEFKKSGSAEVYASQKVDFKNNNNYTVILSGTGNAAKVTVAEDGSLTAPASGKAKVRFVHLSTRVNGSVDIGTSGDQKLITGLAYGQVSNFIEVDGGLALLNAYVAGTTSDPLALRFANLAAGKIYTVVIKGSSEVSTQIVAHN